MFFALAEGFASDTSPPIYLLELYAALLGARVLANVFFLRGGANVVFGIDNNAALVALLKGYGSSELATRVVQAFWYSVVESRCLVWLDRVRSKANKADAPSRLLGETPGADRIPFPVL